MKLKTIYALMAGSLIACISINTYAAESKSTEDENTVVGACMVQKFTEQTPPIKQSIIDKCADVEADAAPKCLGISNETYGTIIDFCILQLKNAKCVSAKMKVPLINYANCGYEKDPDACFKGLGFTTDQIVKLSTDCQNGVDK
jgi:hypothetical protein